MKLNKSHVYLLIRKNKMKLIRHRKYIRNKLSDKLIDLTLMFLTKSYNYGAEIDDES